MIEERSSNYEYTKDVRYERLRPIARRRDVSYKVETT